MAGDDTVDIRFMFVDGSAIGPTNYSLDATVGDIKDGLLAQWPGDGEDGPKSRYEIRMIHLGRTLDNRRTLAESGVVSHLTGEPITMHLVQQPHRPDPPEKKKKQPKCDCSIL